MSYSLETERGAWRAASTSASTSALIDRRLAAHACLALALANVRYWLTVAPVVRAQLRRWESHARAIPDPVLQALALEKLATERFNAEVAATLATLAPRAHRARTVEAIVAFEVMYDYLDGMTEMPTTDPLRDSSQLFQAFLDALAPRSEPNRAYYRYHQRTQDGGYLEALAAGVRVALAELPAATAVLDVARASALRCAEAQTRVHAIPQLGFAQLENWAKHEARGTALQWREFAAGASASVLAIHALLAAAADPSTTPAQAAAIDAAYLYISALSTILDDIVDHESDVRAGITSYLEGREDRPPSADHLAEIARQATIRARRLPAGANHVMTLVGVVAYYSSAPSARDVRARTYLARVHRELRPLIAPTFAVMRTWRIAKNLRRRLERGCSYRSLGQIYSSTMSVIDRGEKR